MRRWKLIAPLAIAAAVALTACSSPSSSTAPTAAPTLSATQTDLYSTAKSEPSLTWYSGQDPARNDAVVAAFLARYPGLKVTSFRLASGELANRYSQETQSGVKTAGLLTLASQAFIQQGQTSGWFAPVDTTTFPELASYPAQYIQNGAVTIGINTFGIGYNTTTVTNVPKDWSDVLDPSYSGKIVFGDPRNVPSYIALALVWDQAYGDDFLTKLKAQNLTVVDSMVPGDQQVAAGEGALGLPSVQTVLTPLTDKGAPIALVVPDLTTGNEFQEILPAAGPSPATAKLLYDFMLTPDGQAAFNGTTGASPINAPGTATLPSKYQVVTPDQIAAGRAKVLSLLGLQ